MAPVFVPGPQRLFDKQAAKARAVDEQVTLEGLAVLQRDTGDETRLAVERDIGDPALLAHHAAALGEAAQEQGVAARIEVIGVVDRRQIVALEILGPRELAEIGRHGLEIEHLDRSLVAALVHAVPDMVEADPAHLVAIGAEGWM